MNAPCIWEGEAGLWILEYHRLDHSLSRPKSEAAPGARCRVLCLRTTTEQAISSTLPVYPSLSQLSRASDAFSRFFLELMQELIKIAAGKMHQPATKNWRQKAEMTRPRFGIGCRWRTARQRCAALAIVSEWTAGEKLKSSM